MPEISAEVHIKRAWGLLEVVEKALEDFRARAVSYSSQLDQDGPFIASLINDARGMKALRSQKSTLLSDLQLATGEIDKAAGLNGEVTVRVGNNYLGLRQLRSIILYLQGQIEAVLGAPHKAMALFFQSNQLCENPDAYYMIGLLYEDQHNPPEALKNFEKCLELEPAGELSVPALREANAMRNYKKQFRGSWGTVLILFVFFFPAAIIYFIAKYK